MDAHLMALTSDQLFDDWFSPDPRRSALWFWGSLLDEALPLLQQWGRQLQRDEIIAAFMRPTALWFWEM